MDKSKYALSNALLSLMREKPYAKISVNDIAKRAYVSRTTFYNHFSEKEDIIYYLLADVFQPLLSLNFERITYEEYLTKYINIVKNSRELFLLMRQSGIINVVPEFMGVQMKNLLESNQWLMRFFHDSLQIELFVEYESRLTFFSVFWLLNHESIRSTENLARMISDIRSIGYREQRIQHGKYTIPERPSLRFEQEDIRARQTKQALYQALAALLCEYQFKEITISNLTERAEVSRCSFYRHYMSMEHLLEETLKYVYVAVIRELPSEGHLIGYSAVLKNSLQGYEEHRSLFAAVAGTDYEMVALRAYRSVLNVLIYQMPYIQSYISADAFTRDYYYWFLALEHIIPVMIYFYRKPKMSIEKYADYMRFCRFFPFRLQDLAAGGMYRNPMQPKYE